MSRPVEQPTHEAVTKSPQTECPRCGTWSATDRCPQCGAHRKSIEASDRPDEELELEDKIQVGT